MNRKNFFKSIGIVLGGMTLSNFLTTLKTGNFRQLRKGAGIYTRRGGTIGWLITKDAVIVVDSQFPDTARDFYSNLKKITAGRITLLFNTHHHRDHTSGNVFLKNYSNMITAQEDCVRLQISRNVGTPLDKNKVTAKVTFEKEWSFNSGDTKVTAHHLCPAHTGGDALIHFVNENIVHMGDLIFNRVYPFVNPKDEASLKGWINFLNYAYNKFDNETLFIYGHSYSPENVFGGREDLKYMANYIEALLEYVGKKVKAGESLENILTAKFIPRFENLKPLWKGALEANIKAAYFELSSG